MVDINVSPDVAAARRVRQKLIARGEEFMRLFGESEKAVSSNSGGVATTPIKRLRQTVAQKVGGQDGESGDRSDTAAAAALSFDVPRTPWKQDPGPPATSSATSRKAKRLFLSGKTAEALARDRSPDATQRKLEADFAWDSFKEMQREVGEFGAGGLDKQRQKSFVAERLKSLGCKPEKGPRIPLSIGKNAVANRRLREQRAFEDAVGSGMEQLKGSGRRKQRQKQMEHRQQKGLCEDGGAFRQGKLDLRFAKRSGTKRRSQQSS